MASHPGDPASQQSAALATLLTTFAPNTINDGMTPNPHASFRRIPSPAIPPPSTTEDDPRLRLATHWQCTLHQLSACYVYDGSHSSAKKFEDATGLTPERFAQAWCECQDSVWRFFHPTQTGRRVAVALCRFWAATTSYWRSITDDRAVAREVVTAAGVEVLKDVKRQICTRLCLVMATGAIDVEYPEHKATLSIQRYLIVIGNPECQPHPTACVCACPVALAIPISYEQSLTTSFIASFTAQLVHKDEAFLYIRDEPSAKLFKLRTSGQTPETFAESCIGTMGAGAHDLWSVPAPASTEHDGLIAAMLSYWALKVRIWRSTTKTRREARTKFEESVRARALLQMIDLRTQLPVPTDVHENHSDDPLCRYVRFDNPRKAGHRHTVVLYAMCRREENFGYAAVRLIPCHEACGLVEYGGLDVQALTRGYCRRDYLKAKAVKAEW